MVRYEEQKNSNDDFKFIMIILAVIIVIVYICTGPFNKFIQISYTIDNIKFAISRAMGNMEPPDYIKYRNDAVYLAKMYPNRPKRSLHEIDKAIKNVSKNGSDSELEEMHRDRAILRLYFGDKKGAIEDFLKAGALNQSDRFKLAILLTESGKYNLAIKYCDSIINEDPMLLVGYVCRANVFEKYGLYDRAMSSYDLAIDRKPGSAKTYIERANAKRRHGDINGYNADISKAKSISQYIDIDSSLVDDAIDPKKLNLLIK